MINALTVDVEDYFHVSAFSSTLKPGQWDAMPSRLERNTQALLELFAAQCVKGTFFVLGWVARRYPDLIRDIVSCGHEVASHGYSHQLVYEQSRKVFASETEQSKKMLEDITGLPVTGYRAASYSITRASLWALDVLVELGFEYDSSIFPVYHDRYGIPSAPTQVHIARAPNGGELVEFPLSIAQVYKYRLPVAGGGYFRLYPYWLSRQLLRKSNRDLGQPFIFYLHPWEIDPEQPRVEGAPLLSRFRHYLNLDRCEKRLRQLVQDFPFTCASDVIRNIAGKGALPTYDYGSLNAGSR